MAERERSWRLMGLWFGLLVLLALATAQSGPMVCDPEGVSTSPSHRGELQAWK